jgi:hypothetical protein
MPIFFTKSWVEMEVFDARIGRLLVFRFLAKNMDEIYYLIQLLCKNMRKKCENVLPISKIVFYPSNKLQIKDFECRVFAKPEMIFSLV